MMSFWRASAGALLALGLVMPMSEIANSASARSGPFVGVGPSMGGGGVRMGGGVRSGPFVGVGPRMGGGGAPRMYSPRASGPKFSAPRASAPRFNPGYKGKGNWSGKGPRGGNWSGKGPGGKHWSGGNWGGKGHRHHGRHRYYPRGFYGYALPYYYDDFYSYSYSDGGCAWLWQRWLETGNPTWKYRYYECIE
ncbi:MAG: hypothetical protein JNL45_17780 [Hyphomicrobium sp.]|nr:hypothetical protein [Hyphomicrobium sp.]